uniref:Possible lipoprotein n=1 Tax=Nonomuraea gerenzanensis TaxID=93944 RepID=A0A1M4E969_9ACTN|nr:possible lipoprotein [Nonomuraea gerenzanensis]
MVFDRQAGKIVATRNAHRKYRSASVVKILIAIDYLERRKSVPAADARLLKVMLRSSDDDAASTLWDRLGKGQIIVRQARKLGLSDTAPPPASKPGFWGYTSLSAYDIVRTYRYLLDTAEPRVRDTILGHLRLSTPCGTDGFDQTFGIPDGVPRPWAVKQGWSGFGTTPPVRCGARAAQTASYTTDARAVGAPISWISQRAADSGVPDYGRPVLHTTGLAGKGDRFVMAVLTAHPAGGTWSSSVKRTTTITRDLYRHVTR